MLRSLVAGKTVPGAIYIVDSHERPNACPSYFSRNRDKQHTVDVHFVRTASDRGPIEKYIGSQDAIRKTRKTMPRFLLVLDDDHEYSPHVVERYSKALRASPSTVFTVQSPPSQLAFRPRFPVAYGSRGVGIRLDLALDGALAAYAAMASRLEPTCRVVDDIVVSAFFASQKIAVRDVPGFSFENRPWRHNNQIRLISKQHALRSDPDNRGFVKLLKQMKAMEAAKAAANRHFKFARWQEAIDAYGEALAIDPDNPRRRGAEQLRFVQGR